MFSYGDMFPMQQRPFSNRYKCCSVGMMPGPERVDVQKGGKIILPPSALDQLTRLNIQYPMLFKLTNTVSGRETHCGVLEFIADEGYMYIPYWMMQNLSVEEYGLIQVSTVSLKVATFAKFQPQSADFLDITNPKAVLENALRNFACLTVEDIVAISYNKKIYELRVMELKPENAVSIIETDMNVDFAPHVGYEERMATQAVEADDDDEDATVDYTQYMEKKFSAFSGDGNRLDGKKKNSDSLASPSNVQEYVRGIPNYNYKIGTITFNRHASIGKKTVSNEEESSFEAFSGKGQAIRKARKP